jgi:hypothetical protein
MPQSNFFPGMQGKICKSAILTFFLKSGRRKQSGSCHGPARKKPGKNRENIPLNYRE